MNIEHANGIALPSILSKIGARVARQKGSEVWYYSPFRTEKTPSFHIHTIKNVWYDFGESRGGKVVDFVCAYLQCQNEDHTPVDALRWLRNIEPSCPAVCFPKEEVVDSGIKLELRKVSPLQNPALINYLQSRGISFLSAKKYIREVLVRNLRTGKCFYALGLPNENGGYELRNKFFKGCIAPKGISFIRGAKLFHEEIHVFEGLMDFLSAVSYQKGNRFEGDVIILNSISCMSQALPYIKDYSYKNLCLWLDNDAAGKKASQAFKQFAEDQRNLMTKPMNETYAAHKDVNAWHMHKLGLKG